MFSTLAKTSVTCLKQINRHNNVFWRRSCVQMISSFFSTEVEQNEESNDLHRTYWRVEMECPEYAESFIRKKCKTVPLIKRQTAWKEYLAAMRSRDTEKNYFDWGGESISTTDKMKPIVYDEITTLAHAEFRFAKDYGIVKRILSDTSIPSFQPIRYLDIGCGSGSSTVSCLDAYPSIQNCVLVDGSEYMLDFTQDFLAERTHSLELSSFLTSSYSSLLTLLENKEEGFDFISMQRFLSDLPSNKARASAVVIAWELLNPGGVLLVEEEGTRWGFHLTRCCRSLILRLESSTHQASILAPCVHQQECPLKGNKNNWCHFCQQCSPGPTAAYKARKKSGEVFSYCLIRKEDETKHMNRKESRVLSTPLKRDKHVLIDLCCPDGSFERRVYSKGKMKEEMDLYRTIRKAEWGGLLSS